ncbi:major facilitator superfamily domain-containing protein [Lipomyces kononenkoae]|uniref:Major facilitator superfamily domain-containing protein n=1 Tax=Lipomyces kononenkoae TaxID=34357 RepID=A0ACC3SRC3_LIPKO
MVGEGHERESLVNEIRDENESKQSTLLHRSAVGSGVASPAPAGAVDDEILRTRLEGEVNVDENFGNQTRSTIYIFLLTLAIGGLQISWSTEFSNGTPFLLSLGMSKTLMSLVWIAGPLSGVLVQPVVGMLSDSCMSPFGRRRPFMVGGAVFTSLSLFLLSWSKDIIAGLLGWFTDSLVVATQLLAIIMVYVLDFSVGTVQASSRAFIVDNVPIHQQQVANAWAAVLTGVGNMIGFILGTMNLPKDFPFLGNTQFKCLAAIASLALVVSVGLACKYIKEKDPRFDLYLRSQRVKRRSIPHFFRETMHGISRLSPQVRLICDTEFFAWTGYFPMLFYTTTYVGEMYYQEVIHARDPSSPSLTSDEIDKLWEEATRYASWSLLFYSLTSLIANILLPLIIAPSYSNPDLTKPSPFRIKWLTLPRSWMLSHIVFAVAMLSTFFIHTGRQATIMIAVLGIPWAHALWAPFALIAEDIARIKQNASHPNFERFEHEAGIIMGVHNVFVSLPQVLSSLASSVIFKFLAKPRGEEDDNSIVWIFRLSGLGAIVAAYLSAKIKTPDQLTVEDMTFEGLESEEDSIDDADRGQDGTVQLQREV